MLLNAPLEHSAILLTCNKLHFVIKTVILLPAHPASFAHNFVSGMQSFYFSESQDAIVLKACH